MLQFTTVNFRRVGQLGLLFVALLALLGAGDDSARFNDLGHKMMCVCGCSQILLECNHVGCSYSDRMRGELMAAVNNGDSDTSILQAFMQKYGTAVIAAPGNTGFNRVAWLMPYLMLGFGIMLVVLIVRAWRNRPLVLPAGTPAPVSGPELDHFREQARQETEL